MEPPKMTPFTTLGKLGDCWEVPFFGSFRGSGTIAHIRDSEKEEPCLPDLNADHKIPHDCSILSWVWSLGFKFKGLRFRV